MKHEPITPAEYRALQQAYDFFNRELFGGSLPPVLVTLQRHGRAYGYFSPERFVGRAEQEVAHELALNPDHFGRTDEVILSTWCTRWCMSGSRNTAACHGGAITIGNGQPR